MRTPGRPPRPWQRRLWEGCAATGGSCSTPGNDATGLLVMPYFAVFELLSPMFALGGLVVTIVLFARRRELGP
jgi:hypothetical protein